MCVCRRLSEACNELREETVELSKSLVHLQQTARKSIAPPTAHPLLHGNKRNSTLVTSSTMTDGITTADSTTQVDAVSSQEEIIRVWSSISSFLSTDNNNNKGVWSARRRHCSDGHVAFNQWRGRGQEQPNPSVRQSPLATSNCGVMKKVGMAVMRQRAKSVPPSVLAASSIKKSRKDSRSGRKVSVQAPPTKEHCSSCIIWQEKLKHYQQKLKSLSKQVIM